MEQATQVKKSIFKKWWFWVLAVFVIAVIGSQSKKRETEAANTSSSSSSSDEVVVRTPSVSASTLFSDYEANEIAASNKYEGKFYKVSGTADDIGKDIMDDGYVTLKTSGLFGVQCFFENEQELASIQKGQQITVHGRVDGKLGNVFVKECKLSH